MARRFWRGDKFTFNINGFSPGDIWSKPYPYFSTLTPFQNATYPLICFAASFGSG